MIKKNIKIKSPVQVVLGWHDIWSTFLTCLSGTLALFMVWPNLKNHLQRASPPWRIPSFIDSSSDIEIREGTHPLSSLVSNVAFWFSTVSIFCFLSLVLCLFYPFSLSVVDNSWNETLYKHTGSVWQGKRNLCTSAIRPVRIRRLRATMPQNQAQALPPGRRALSIHRLREKEAHGRLTLNESQRTKETVDSITTYQKYIQTLRHSFRNGVCLSHLSTQMEQQSTSFVSLVSARLLFDAVRWTSYTLGYREALERLVELLRRILFLRWCWQVYLTHPTCNEFVRSFSTKWSRYWLTSLLWMQQYRGREVLSKALICCRECSLYHFNFLE